MSNVLLYTFISPDLFEQVAKVGAQATQKVALIIIPVFLLFELGVSVVKFLMGGKGDFLNLNKFFSYILIWFFTFQYLPVMNMISSFVDAIEMAVWHGVDPKGQGINVAQTMLELDGKEENVVRLAIMLSQGKTQEGYEFFKKNKMNASQWQNARKLSKTDKISASSGGDTGFFDYMSKLINAPFGILAVIIEAFNSGFMVLLRMLLEILSAILTTLLIAVGPLAIAFNMMPFGINEGVLKNWFGTWFSVRCWMITVTLIDLMQLSLMNDTDARWLKTNSASILQDLGGIGINVVISIAFVILYIITPFITNLYTKGSGGQFLSLFVGTVAMAAKAAAKAAGGGGGGK